MLHRLMFFKTFLDKCWPVFRLLIHRRVEDVLFQLRVRFKLNEDMFSNLPFRSRITRGLILLKEIPHLLVIGF